MTDLDKLLEKHYLWAVQNVEHGIYIALPSPETKSAIQHLIDRATLQARIDEVKDAIFNVGFAESEKTPGVNGLEYRLATLTKQQSKEEI